MTWTKVGDEFAAAAERLSDAAFRTHIEALIWSNAQGLDLLIPRKDLRRFAYSDRAAEACAELVAAGWWQDHVDTWFIGARFADWQEDASDVDRRRALNAERQRRWRKHRLGDHSMCESRHCTAAPRTGETSYPPAGVTRDVTHNVTRDVTRDSEYPQASDTVTRDITRNVTPPRTVPSRPVPSRPEGVGGTGTGREHEQTRGFADAPRPPYPVPAAERAHLAAEPDGLPHDWTGQPCPHGMPYGTLPHPGNDVPRCVLCRRGTPATYELADA